MARLGRTITAVAKFKEFNIMFKEHSRTSKDYKELSEKFEELRKGPGQLITLSFDDNFK